MSHLPEESEFFRNNLTKISDEVWFQAPESDVPWIKLHDCLEDYMPEVPEEDWQWEVCSIVTTKSVEELKQLI